MKGITMTVTQSVIAVETLYQENPRVASTFNRYNGCKIKNRSFTDSLESYQNGASKEARILCRNGREPTKEIVLNLLTILSAQDIKALRTKIFRYLKEHGLEAVASIELTRDSDGKPNNRVHFHILTDDLRSQRALRRLFNTACLSSGLTREAFRIGYRKLWNGERYFNYFAKFRYSREVILFKKGLRIQKFYVIGQWYRKSKKRYGKIT